MASLAIPVSVSDTLVLALNQSVNEIATAMRQQYAMKMFQEGKLTLGQSAEFCGVSYRDFMDMLSDAGIPVADYGADELDAELDRLGVEVA
jgi:predicted HTH domain antitoxin